MSNKKRRQTEEASNTVLCFKVEVVENTIGKAFAGHAARGQKMKTEHNYDNPLTDMVNLIIAERKLESDKLDRHRELSKNK